MSCKYKVPGTEMYVVEWHLIKLVIHAKIYTDNIPLRPFDDEMRVDIWKDRKQVKIMH